MWENIIEFVFHIQKDEKLSASEKHNNFSIYLNAIQALYKA